MATGGPRLDERECSPSDAARDGVLNAVALHDSHVGHLDARTGQTTRNGDDVQNEQDLASREDARDIAVGDAAHTEPPVLVAAYSVARHVKNDRTDGGDIRLPIDLTDGIIEPRHQAASDLWLHLVFQTPVSPEDFAVSVTPHPGLTATLSSGPTENELTLAFDDVVPMGQYDITLDNGSGETLSFPICFIEGDVNCSGDTTALDLARIQHPANWNLELSPGVDPRADINRDRQVTGLDLALVQSPTNWNQPVPALTCLCVDYAKLRACCLPDGTCMEILPSHCEAEGGWEGPTRVCLGDTDEDGIDDTCAAPDDMVLVASGPFEMGESFDECRYDERPVHTVHLSAYWIDKYEVTNQQYADALNWAYAQGEKITIPEGVVYQYGTGMSCAYCDTTSSSPHSRIQWDGSTFTVTPGYDHHPMARVSWYGAVAYCNWRSAMEGRPQCYNLSTWECDFGVGGYRLPTEAEWEKAAGWDPIEQRHYRFGEHTDGCGYGCLDGRRANYLSSGDPYEYGPVPTTTPVGFYNGEMHYQADFDWPGSATCYQTQDARSYYGCYDMTGNLWEWCYDWYSDSYYSTSPELNPRGPDSGTRRVIRGGNWLNGPDHCRSADRRHTTPYYRLYSRGFRCALGTP
jgi:formylglycine-generating enzyme required for sulfatase activity